MAAPLVHALAWVLFCQGLVFEGVGKKRARRRIREIAHDAGGRSLRLDASIADGKCVRTVR